MTTPFLAIDIEREEGRKHEAYPDPLTGGDPWTIGIGQTGPGIRKGTVWTDAQIDDALDGSIRKVEASLDDHLPWWRTLCDARQDVLVQMGFQMGVQGLCAFHNTLSAMERGDYAAAAAGMLGSRWARQTPNRAKRLADQMLSGERP